MDEPGPVEWAKYKALQAENAELKRENEFLGKASAFFGSRSTCEMNFYAFTLQEKAVFPITWMCKRLGVSRASYYRWSKPAGLTPTAKRHVQLRDEVVREFKDSNQMAGRDQLTTLLNQRGVKVSSGTVGAIMNE